MEHTNINLEIPDSGKIITEKTYPISTLWIFKGPIIIIAISFIAILFGYYFPYLLILLPIYLIVNPLTKSKFHYSVNAENLWVKEGLFSKSERTFPYNSIQNVMVKRDLFDRIFGLGTVYVNNTIEEPGDTKSMVSNILGMNKNPNTAKDGVEFTGLKAGDAEILKDILFKKIEFNKSNDKKVGL